MNSPTYDISILFRRAENLPIADLASLSSDPYVFATLHTTFSDRDSDHNPPLRFRTPTQRGTTDPEWEWRWDVSNVPRQGTRLRVELLDEDVRDHDDKLGHAMIDFATLANWPGDEEGVNEEWYKLRKKGASKKAAVLRLCAAGVKKGEGRTARVLISIKITGETQLPKEKDIGRAFTSGPNCWSKHYSPLIGKVIHSKDSSNDPEKASVFSFEANKLQLSGPPPPELSHNYVGFAPFVTAYFTRSGLRGRLLNQALHSQYKSIYSHDSSTEYGVIDKHHTTTNEEKTTGEEKARKEDNALAKRFLEMVHWSDGHRIFTYVITLDAEWRFTETGDEFAIDLLSKHGLHSDVSRVIAFSGEFFVRRKKKHGVEHSEPEGTLNGAQNGDAEEEASSSVGKGKGRGEDGGGDEPEISPTKPKHPHLHPHGHAPDHDPSHYELVIDNDSGTYRPNKDYLPQLTAFLQENLHGIGGIVTFDCFDKELEKLKKERKEAKQQEGRRIFRQRSLSSMGSSISSSDEEELETGQESNVFKRLKGRFMMSGGQTGTGGMAVQAARTVAATAR